MDVDAIKKVIDKVIKEIQEQQSYRSVALKNDLKFVKDLGFKSLDIAELIATLENELGVDPFSEGASIMNISTIGELYKVYQESIAKK